MKLPKSQRDPLGTKKGFTLIELLVVIAVIAFLGTIAIAYLHNARTKARDTKRLHDIELIETAMMLYYDKYGMFPQDTEWGGNCTGVGSEGCNGNIGDKDIDGRIDIDDALAEFMPETPQDPSYDSSNPFNYTYYYDQNHLCTGLGANYYPTIHVTTMETLGIAPDNPCVDASSEFCNNPCDSGGEGNGDNAHYLIPLIP